MSLSSVAVGPDVPGLVNVVTPPLAVQGRELEQGKWVKTGGWGDAQEARAELEASLATSRSGK